MTLDIEPTNNSTQRTTKTTAATSSQAVTSVSTGWFTRLLVKIGVSKPTSIQPDKAADESSISTQADSASGTTDGEWDIVEEHDIVEAHPMYHTQITLLLSEAAKDRTAKHYNNITPKAKNDEELANEELTLVQRALLDYAVEKTEAEKEVPLVQKILQDTGAQLEIKENQDEENLEYKSDLVDDDDFQYKSDQEDDEYNFKD